MIRIFTFAAILLLFMAAQAEESKEQALSGEIKAETEKTEPAKTEPAKTEPDNPGPDNPGPDKNEVKYSVYSKNQFNLHRDFKLTTESVPDTYIDMSTETGGEVKYRNYTFGLRKNMLLFIKKNPSKEQSDNGDGTFSLNPINNQVTTDHYKFSDEFFEHGWQQYIDRIYMKGDWKNINVTVGDFYESMNRGLIFSMTKDPIVGDNSIRGLSINSKIDKFHAKLFGGVANPNLRDFATKQRTQESHDELWGTEFGYNMKKVDVAVEYAGGYYGDYTIYKSGTGEAEQSKLFHIIGAYVSMNEIFPQFSLYAGATILPYGYERQEYINFIKKTVINRQDMALGNSVFLSTMKWFDFCGDRLTITAEMKRYDKYFLNYTYMESTDFKRVYFNPPSLMWQELEINNQFDTWAGRGKVSFAENNVTGAIYSVEAAGGKSLYNDDKYIGIYEPEDFYFLGATFDKRFSQFFVTAKLAFMDLKGETTGGGKTKRETIFANLVLGGNISKFSAKLNTDLYHKEVRYRNLLEYSNYIEIRNILDMSWANMYFLALSGTYSKNNLPEFDGLSSLNTSDNRPKYYPGISIGFKYKIVRISAFYGKEKGGKVCSQGQCRYIPDFTGFKSELEIDL